LPRGSTGAPTTDDERAAVDFAERMARADLDVDEATFQKLRARFTDAQLVELSAWVGLQAFHSTFNRALRIEIDEP
jgi:alkylhydroperoxidase family enzyme